MPYAEANSFGAQLSNPLRTMPCPQTIIATISMLPSFLSFNASVTELYRVSRGVNLTRT